MEHRNVSIKSRIVGNRLGDVAQSLRELISSHTTMLLRPEDAALQASAIISTRLRDRLTKSGGLFIDVGAHIGSAIAGVKRRSQASTIIAVEAMPDKAANLRKVFPDVEVVNYALGEKSGKASFTIDLENSGYSSLDPDLKERGGRYKIIEVAVTTLDEVIGSRAPDFVKIDVEGAELGVLRGAEKMLAESRPAIMFESASREMDGYPKRATYEFLAARGYQMFMPARLAHDAPSSSLEVFVDAHEYPRLTLDWFAIPGEKREEYRDRARLITGVRPGS